jgi:Uma2 family endonuclease
MAQVIRPKTASWTAEDLTSRFGAIPLNRIIWDPAPGTATVEDVVFFDDHRDQLCELIDGTLVRKAGGLYESYLAVQIITLLHTYVSAKDFGIVAGESGMMQLFPDEVRIPDVSFISHARLANSGFPEAAAPHMAPELAVEVISRSNTREEMNRKVKEYFEAGTKAVWYVYPKTRKVVVYSSPKSFTELSEDDTLDAGAVLPGFTLELKDLFAKPAGLSDQPK